MFEPRNGAWRLLVGLVGLTGIGCGADGSASDDLTLATEEVPEQAERVLAELSYGSERHEFLLLGEGPDAMVSHRIVGSAGGGSALPALASAELPPTLLETFLALAPAGLEAPPELVARHAQQARALGRTEDVLVPLIDKQLTPPAGVNGCDRSLFFDVVSSAALRGWTTEIITGGLSDSYHCAGGPSGTVLGLPSASSCTFLSQQLMLVGVCAIEGQVLARVGFGNRDVWSVSRGTLLDPNEYIVQILADDITPHRMAAIGESDQASYGLRVGVLRPNTGAF